MASDAWWSRTRPCNVEITNQKPLDESLVAVDSSANSLDTTLLIQFGKSRLFQQKRRKVQRFATKSPEANHFKRFSCLYQIAFYSDAQWISMGGGGANKNNQHPFLVDFKGTRNPDAPNKKVETNQETQPTGHRTHPP